jgi:ribosomal protein S18 acetylase RimI-like enzyme
VALNVVDLQYQRCGIGSQLLQWGLTHAQNESVPVTVKSSKRAQRVYRRNGFREIGCLQVADNVEGYAMLWESIPRGCKSA